MTDLTQIKCFTFNGQPISAQEMKYIYTKIRRKLAKNRVVDVARELGITYQAVYYFMKQNKDFAYMSDDELQDVVKRRLKFHTYMAYSDRNKQEVSVAMDDYYNSVPTINNPRSMGQVAAMKW